MSFNDVGLSLRHHQILLVSFHEILRQGMSLCPGYSRAGGYNILHKKKLLKAGFWIPSKNVLIAF